MGRRKGTAEQQTDDTEYSSHSQYTATAGCESNTDSAALNIDSVDNVGRQLENMHQNSLQRQQSSPCRAESDTAGGDTLSNQPKNPEYRTNKGTSPSCVRETEVERHTTYLSNDAAGQNRRERCDVRPLLYNRGSDGSDQHRTYRTGNQHEQINSTREPNWNHRMESATNAAWSSPPQSHSYTGHFTQANFRPYVNDRDQHRQDSLLHQHRHRFEQQFDGIEYQQHRAQRQTSYNDIKIPPFTGKEDWWVWINRFEVIAERNQWNKDEMVDHILPRLQGHAGDFVYTQLSRWKLFDYNELRAELTNQFRVIETQQSYAAKFSKRDQLNGETAEEYAAELKRLYAKAYKSRGNPVRQEDLVRRFLDGLEDSDARFEVEFNKDPRTIDEAVYHVVRFIHVRQTREEDPYNERKKKRFTRQVYEDSSSEEESDYYYDTERTEARVCRNGSISERQLRDSKRDTKQEDKASSSLHATLLEVISKLNQIVSQYSMRERREYTCFACGEEGHFIRDCPQKSEQQKQDQDKSTSQYRQKQNHLNL